MPSHTSRLPNSVDQSDASPPGAARRPPLRSLELFAGPGGLALGVHQAGFHHLALIERETFAARTLRNNCQHSLGIAPEQVLFADAQDVNYQRYLGQVDLLAAGPPCQPFSTGGKALGPDDARNMFPLLLDIVPQVMPRAILIENVKGLTRDKFRPYFDYIVARLKLPFFPLHDGETWQSHFARLQAVDPGMYPSEQRYVVNYQVVNAANYGVPQSRQRVLVVAFRLDLGIQPFRLHPTHSKDALLWGQWVTQAYWVRHHITCEVLPDSFLSANDQKRVGKLRANLFPSDDLQPWCTVRDAIADLPPPVPRGQMPGMSNHVQHPGARAYTGHTGSLMDWPAKALKAGGHGTPGGENMLQVPGGNQVRYFTTREAARLQTFPDTWVFDGKWGRCIQQLGNAVPVRLARIWASEIRHRLESIDELKDGEHGDGHGGYHTTSTDPVSARGDRIRAVAVRGGAD